MPAFSRLAAALLAASFLPVTAVAADADPAAHGHDHATPAPAAADAATPAGDDGAGLLLQRMRDLHTRLATVKSPGERQKLMAESRRLMQDAMALLDAPPAAGNGMMDHDHGAMAPVPGSAAGNVPAPGPGERKPMGGMDMQQCMRMHEARARHMQLMHAVLQALVDQQAAAAPGK